MAEFIIHHNGAYNIYGTIADGAHYESALTLDQLRQVIQREQGETVNAGETSGRLVCGKCGAGIRWSGRNGKSAGSCTSCRDVRWAEN